MVLGESCEDRSLKYYLFEQCENQYIEVDGISGIWFILEV